MPQIEFTISRVQVRGSRGDIYLVSATGVVPIACTCPDFVNRSGPQGRSCKHMIARAGLSSVGVTRCYLCSALLTISEMDEQSRPDGFSRHGQPRICDGCARP